METEIPKFTKQLFMKSPKGEIKQRGRTMSNAYVIDAVRTPRGKGKKEEHLQVFIRKNFPPPP